MIIIEEPLYFEHFDLDSVITPVNVKEFERLLMESGYNQEKSAFLLDGFRNGFKLEYNGPENVRIESKNLYLDGVGNKVMLWNKVMKEVKAKRYAGPFKKAPFEYYIQSPIGLAPKDNGQDVRLIFHLFHPRGPWSSSVNANTPREKCSVRYPDFNKAIELCIKAGKYCKISKLDMKSAFRNLGLTIQIFSDESRVPVWWRNVLFC